MVSIRTLSSPVKSFGVPFGAKERFTLPSQPLWPGAFENPVDAPALPIEAGWLWVARLLFSTATEVTFLNAIATVSCARRHQLFS